MPRTNWAGNHTYSAPRLHAPKSIAELREIVSQSERIKALGARHSFNGVADSPLDQVSLKHFTGMEILAGSNAVRVGAGVTYGQLAPFLHSRGYALGNLASLPHISVAGACATGTHGSGSANGNLSTAVSALELVTADGRLADISDESHEDGFSGTVVSLGALGIVTALTLRIEPAYAVRQAVYLDLPFRQLESHLVEIFASGNSVSLFTEWRDEKATQVWIKRRDNAPFPAEIFGARLAPTKLHPLAGHSAESCTEQLGVPGPWHERLPHFRMDFTPSSGDELQTEYFVPLVRGYEAIRAVEQLRDRVSPLLFVSEFRTVAADELWLSPCFRRDSLAIHFTWKPDWPVVRDLLPLIEEKLEPFDPRPHWAKLSTLSPADRYEKLPDFLSLRRFHDPAGKFENEYLTALFG